MEPMKRRGFLQGLFGGLAAGGVLLRAEPEAVRTLALRPEEPLIVQPQQIAHPDALTAYGEVLYNARGEAVCMVRQVDYHMDRQDVTAWGDSSRSYIPAMPHVVVIAEGLPALYMEFETKPLLTTRGKRRR